MVKIRTGLHTAEILSCYMQDLKFVEMGMMNSQKPSGFLYHSLSTWTLSIGSQGKNSICFFLFLAPSTQVKKRPYPKTSTYLVPLLNETSLKLGKKKKCSFCPSIVFQNSRTFLCEIYPKNRQYRLWQGDINHGKFPSRFFSNGKKKKIEQKDFRTENVNQFSLLASIFKTPIPPPSSSCIYLHMSTKTLRCILLNSLTLSSSISRASQIATSLYFIFSCSENPVFFSSPSYLICQLRVTSVYISVTSI